MTIQDKWNCFKARFASDYSSTLEERIKKQVQGIYDLTATDSRFLGSKLTETNENVAELRQTVAGLSRRSESVDAFYVKTVTTALSERQDKIALDFAGSQAQQDQINAKRFDALIAQIDNLVKDLRAESARIDTVSANHAKLISKLRAGLGEG